MIQPRTSRICWRADRTGSRHDELCATLDRNVFRTDIGNGLGTWHGLCTAVRTEAKAGDGAFVIEQTITLERHYTDAD